MIKGLNKALVALIKPFKIALKNFNYYDLGYYFLFSVLNNLSLVVSSTFMPSFNLF